MQPTPNTLPESIRIRSVALLNRHLAAAIDLRAQAKQAHWNVRGPGFIAIHDLFGRVARAIDGYGNQIAGRAAALGGTARGTIQEAVEGSFLLPYPLGIADGNHHVFAISAALAAFGQSARDGAALAMEFGDADTADLFTEISRDLDQQLWQVASNIAPK